jgi:hypothetical protein
VNEELQRLLEQLDGVPLEEEQAGILLLDLRIRDVYPLSEIFSHPGSDIKRGVQN